MDEVCQEVLDTITITQPCVIVKGTIQSGAVEKAILVIEKQIICTFDPKDIPAILLSAFYVFNMHYTEGCTNFYSALEALLLQQKAPNRKTRLAAFLSRFDNI